MALVHERSLHRAFHWRIEPRQGSPLPRSLKAVADLDRRLLRSTELSMSKLQRTQGCGDGSYGYAVPLQFYA